MLDINGLPDDKESLKKLVLEQHAASQSKDIKLREKDRQIEHLKLQLARLRRWKFGQSSENIPGLEQLPLSLEDLKAVLNDAGLDPAIAAEKATPVKNKPVRRKQFPEHFGSVENLISADACQCPDCGAPLKLLGKDGNPDVAEVVEVKTITFTVTRHIRPKKRCMKCATIVQAPAPARPIPRSFAGATLLALILTWKYRFHIPLHRQCQFFAHAGFTVSSSTLVDWVGQSSALLGPLVQALARYVLSASNLNADDTPVKVLAPGTGKTKTGRLWTYVRDGRPWGSTDPPAVWYQYSPSRHGKHPQKHLKAFTGKLQVDAFAGFNALFLPDSKTSLPRIEEIACGAHIRRGFFDIYEARQSPVAKEALDRIRDLYEIEDLIRGYPPEVRLATRQEHAVPLLKSMHEWMVKTAPCVENNSDLFRAFQYAFNNWEAFTRYAQDGRLEIDNNSAERSIRGVAVGRRNYLFFGADSGGERAAIIYSLTETCRLNNIDAERYLSYVLERIGEHPINRIEELLPWNVADQLKQPQAVTQALAA